jgi:hypothetical protein
MLPRRPRRGAVPTPICLALIALVWLIAVTATTFAAELPVLTTARHNVGPNEHVRHADACCLNGIAPNACLFENAI